MKRVARHPRRELDIVPENFAGFRGSSHTRFGGPGEENPHSKQNRPCGLFAEPQRLHCRRFARKHKSFLTNVVSRAAPTASRRTFGKEKRSTHEVRDSVEESVDGVGFVLGV